MKTAGGAPVRVTPVEVLPQETAAASDLNEIEENETLDSLLSPVTIDREDASTPAPAPASMPPPPAPAPTPPPAPKARPPVAYDAEAPARSGGRGMLMFGALFLGLVLVCGGVGVAGVVFTGGAAILVGGPTAKPDPKPAPRPSPKPSPKPRRGKKRR